MVIFWDFNGTILDDLQLSFDLLNVALEEEGFPPVTLKRYKEIFTFPIKDYYRAAGFDFVNTSFEELAIRFIERYQPASLKLNLHEGLVDTVLLMRQKGHKNIVLSASRTPNLIEQLKHFKIDHLFDDILGIDDIYAKSKVDIAKSYVLKHQIKPSEMIIIGDTLHDAEVANSLNCDIIIYTGGHQAKHRFGSLKTIDHFEQIERIIDQYGEKE